MLVIRKSLGWSLSWIMGAALWASAVNAQGVGSAFLSVTDVKPAGLVEKLRVRQDALSQYLFEQLDERTQQLIAQTTDANTVSDELRYLLINGLNKILQGPALYEENRFAGITLSSYTRQLLEKNPTDDHLVRLNRWLLEDAFPGAITNSQFAMGSSLPAPLPITPLLKPATRNGTPPATPAAPAPEVNLPPAPTPFHAALRELRVNLPEDCSDEVGQRILAEYGAVFVAWQVAPPPRCLFNDESEVHAFQSQPGLTATYNWGGQSVTLQNKAWELLRNALNEARRTGVRITPRGQNAAERTFAATVKYWDSRLNPGLAHWVQRGKLTPQDAARIRALPIREQVAEVLKLEAQGLYFSKDFAKSILYSVAAPGSSQHIAMLALDIEEYRNPRVRALLARYGWFQTVKSDLPHFTYLGAERKDLEKLGLRPETVDGQEFWVPDLRPYAQAGANNTP